MLAFWPPKPNELDRATSTTAGRGRGPITPAGSRDRVRGGGRCRAADPGSSASRQAAISIAPAAAIRWPTAPLIELTGTVGVRAEGAADRPGLGRIVQRRAGAVGVDVADGAARAGRPGRSARSIAAARRRAVGSRGGDPVAILAAAPAEHRAPAAVAPRRARAPPTPARTSPRLPHRQAVAPAIEGPAGVGSLRGDGAPSRPCPPRPAG